MNHPTACESGDYLSLGSCRTKDIAANRENLSLYVGINHFTTVFITGDYLDMVLHKMFT